MSSPLTLPESPTGHCYHVARGDTCIGQFSLEEILARVEKGELDPFDHVFDDAQRDWVSIIVHPVFAAKQDFWKRFRHVNVAKPAALDQIPKGAVFDTLSLPEGIEAWFVLKGDHRFGPFEYLELVRLLQGPLSEAPSESNSKSDHGDGGLSDWDYVWTKRLPKWTRISSLPEFQPSAIKDLRAQLSEKLGGTVNEVFFRRRFARANFSGSILVHNNQKLFKGLSVELGAGGLSLQLLDGELKVGDHVHVHVRPSSETPAFNAPCEVVSRRALHAGDAKSPVVYGMKFVALNDRVKTEIDGWATRQHNKRNSSEAA